MKIVFDSDNRGVAYSFYYGVDLPPEIEEKNYAAIDLILSGDTIAYSPYARTLEGAKAVGAEAVRAAYAVAVDAWVPDGTPGTYSYYTAEVLAIQDARTGTSSVTITQKTIDGGATAPVSVNYAEFNVIADSVSHFVADLITEYDGYLANIASAETVEAIDAILAGI
jgi:hypothetical protein